MQGTTSIARNLGHAAVRMIVSAVAVLLLVWIAVAGLIAVVGRPYLLAVYWLLGFLGLLSCAGAVTSTVGLDEEAGGRVLHPLRSLACLGSSALIGILFWTQAAGVVEGKGQALEVVATILAVTTVIGIAGLLVLSATVLLADQGGREIADRPALTVERGG